MKPMLATAVDDLTKIKYPVLVSWKADGIRVLIKDGVALSRSLKPIPNLFIQNWVSCNADALEGLDGELIVGDISAPDVFNVTTSAVMSRDGEMDFKMVVFDIWDAEPNVTAVQRLRRLRSIASLLPKRAHVLAKYIANKPSDVEYIENALLSEGAEGVDSTYKFGRSTLKEQKLLKLKRFSDEEFEVVGFVEKLHNANEAKINEVGNTERSSHKENMIPMNTLGALTIKIWDGSLCNVGTGFDDKTRQHIWDNREQYLGKLAKVKHFPVGAKDSLRFPVFIGWRSELDIGE
ncbi:DNA ligase [compost metagenome]